MLWWLKARNAHTVLPAALAFFVLLVALFQDAVVDLPSFLTGSDTPILFMSMTPVPVCAALGMALDSRLAAAEQTGTRSVGLLDAGLAVVVISATAGAGWGLGEVLDSSAAQAAGRNVAFLTGIMLCVRAIAGPRAVMAPVAWIFAVIFLGFDQSRQPYFWTILPEPGGAPHAALAAITSFTVGLIVLANNHRIRFE